MDPPFTLACMLQHSRPMSYKYTSGSPPHTKCLSLRLTTAPQQLSRFSLLLCICVLDPCPVTLLTGWVNSCQEPLCL